MAKPKPRITLQRRPTGEYSAPEDDGIERYSTGKGGLVWPAKRGNRHGRKLGTPNAVSILMKAAILEGAARSQRGRGTLVNYLAHVADEFPTQYMRLLARLIPHDLRVQLRNELNTPLETPEEVRARLKARGINIDKLGPLFERPQVPQPREPVHRRYVGPPRDEDQLLDREQPQPVAEVSEPEPPRGNPWASDLRHRPVQPHKLGPLPVNGEPGSQFELPWGGGSSNMDLHAWSWGRPPRLVSNNTDEDQTDATPTPERSAVSRR
jgi:hypothetical protein